MRAAIEETTIRSAGPRSAAASRRFPKARTVLTRPIRFASSIRSRSSASDSSAGEGSITPALATTRSKSPSIASSAARSATSAATNAPPSSFASASMRSWRRATRVTWAPAAASARAVAAPIPEEAPVTSAVRFMAAMLRRAGAASQSSRDPRTPKARMPRARRARLFGMAELGDFLRTRRARLQPQDVGLPDHGRRRVPGLRREELAQLAGVSVDYYVRLEQGRDIHPSEQVLEAIARALA